MIPKKIKTRMFIADKEIHPNNLKSPTIHNSNIDYIVNDVVRRIKKHNTLLNHTALERGTST